MSKGIPDLLYILFFLYNLYDPINLFVLMQISYISYKSAFLSIFRLLSDFKYYNTLKNVLCLKIAYSHTSIGLYFS